VHSDFDALNLTTACINANEWVLNNCDIIVDCNCSSLDKKLLEDTLKQIKSDKVRLIHDHVNETGGVGFGHWEQIARWYDAISQYDAVVHLHADVFLIDDFAIRRDLESCVNENYDFMLFDLPDREGIQSANDLFIFSPKNALSVFSHWEELGRKYFDFANWHPSKKTVRDCCEHYLYLLTRQLNVGYLDRSPCAGMGSPPRYEQNMGIISNPNPRHETVNSLLSWKINRS
jgi:hypothetical protein